MSGFEIRPPRASDRAGWERLARGYKAFYETELADADYELAWRRLLAGDVVHGLVLQQGGQLIGLTHYLFHASTWSPAVCYLQDLFVAEQARGQGLAQALITAVAARAHERGATRTYWLTHRDNSRARALYERVAQHRGFLRYDCLL